MIQIFNLKYPNLSSIYLQILLEILFSKIILNVVANFYNTNIKQDYKNKVNKKIKQGVILKYISLPISNALNPPITLVP